MTKKKDRSTRTGWVMVITMGVVMGGVLGYGYYIDEFQQSAAETVALGLHIEDTTCDNVALAMVANYESERSIIVRTELDRVWQEGGCDSIATYPDRLAYP